MKAWYIISSYNTDELSILLETMGIEYVNPVSLRTEIRHNILKLHEFNMIGGYIFARLDINADYYQIMHNNIFYHNVIGILRTDTQFIQVNEKEVLAWKELSEAVSLPLRLRLKNGHFRVLTKSLTGAKVIRFYRKKLKVTIELPINGRIRRVTVAAYDIGNHSITARTLASIWRKERKQAKAQSRYQHVIRIRRMQETLQILKDKIHPITQTQQRNRLIIPVTEGHWTIASWNPINYHYLAYISRANLKNSS